MLSLPSVMVSACRLQVKPLKYPVSDKTNGKHYSKIGIPTILSSEEEKILVNWVLKMTQGFPVTKDQLCDSVQQIFSELKRPNSFTNNRLRRNWYKRFMRRHPALRLRTTQNLSKQYPKHK